ncbi:hypothetical protein PCH70_46640 [Pseudomonas cichorii JBC1]|nr:hypothetical protein PCH70_46640 [Pseudomonas cichorii JBC1]
MRDARFCCRLETCRPGTRCEWQRNTAIVQTLGAKMTLTETGRPFVDE